MRKYTIHAQALRKKCYNVHVRCERHLTAEQHDDVDRYTHKSAFIDHIRKDDDNSLDNVTQWAKPTPLRPDGTNLLPFPVNALPSNATLLLNSGVDLKVVSEHLGHRDAEIYADVLRKTKARTAEQIELCLA